MRSDHCRRMPRLFLTTIVATASIVGCNDQSVTQHAVDNGAVPDDEGGRQIRVLSTLPDFRLTNQNDEMFSSDELRGKVWIATFIFTRCGATCPAQTDEFSRLQSMFRKDSTLDEVAFVSITVDPSYDTPAVLLKYAKDAGADLSNWSFLTGDRQAIWRLSKDGFKLPVFETENDPDALIAHSSRFILVDRLGRIRDYYDGIENDSVRRLVEDLKTVLQELSPATTVQPLP